MGPDNRIVNVAKKKRTSSPSPGDLPDPGIEPGCPALQVGSLPTELSGKPHRYRNKLVVTSRKREWEDKIGPGSKGHKLLGIK